MEREGERGREREGETKLLENCKWRERERDKMYIVKEKACLA